MVQDNVGPFIRARAREGKDLLRYVIKEFEEYLQYGRLEHPEVDLSLWPPPGIARIP